LKTVCVGLIDTIWELFIVTPTVPQISKLDCGLFVPIPTFDVIYTLQPKLLDEFIHCEILPLLDGLYGTPF